MLHHLSFEWLLLSNQFEPDREGLFELVFRVDATNLASKWKFP
jgi:hypothetical protein